MRGRNYKRSRSQKSVPSPVVESTTPINSPKRRWWQSLILSTSRGHRGSLTVVLVLLAIAMALTLYSNP